MSDKILNTRVKQKIDTKANWDKAVNFVPLKGEIIVYSDLNKIKVGDGAKKVGELPFLADNDTKVTSAANHYTPTADSSAQLSVDASSTTTATWNSTQLVTGVNLQRDAKGHVTGVTVDSIKMPANPDTHQSIKTLNTSNTAAQTVSSSEAIAGSGTINLHKVAKTGSYNDLNNKPTIPTVNNGQLTVQKNGTTVATFAANQGGNTTANITVPTKLADLSDRTFSNITSRGEEYLDWGGTSHSGSVSPIGMCLSAEHSANRVALINPNALTFEYSSDGGTTWTAYSHAGADKTKFCTTSLSLPIGRPNTSTDLVANKSKTRITITAQNGTKGYVYTSLKKMLVQVSTATTLSLLVETRTGTNYKNNGAWSSVGTYNLSGWSGWNDIPTLFSLGGGTTQTGNNWQMRLTITCTTVSSSYPKTAEVLGIRLFGDNCWTQASTLAGTGNIYTYDMSGNVTFPGTISMKGGAVALKGDIKSSTAKSTTGISVSASLAAAPEFTGTAHGHTITDNGHIHTYSKAKASGTASVLNSATFKATYTSDYGIKFEHSTGTTSVVSGIGYETVNSGSAKTGISLANATAGGSVSKPNINVSVTDPGHTHTI